MVRLAPPPAEVRRSRRGYHSICREYQ